MKKILIIFITSLTIFLTAEDIPFNFTVVPGVNIFPGENTTNLSTGLISSEVYELDGIQLGPVYAVSVKEMDGIQASGVLNIAGGETDGIQAAGVVNIAGYVDGLQAAGTVNLSDDLNGFQAAGVVNIAEDVDGFQVSGVVNIAESFDGGQVGVVNISSKADGIQVGVINIVSESSNDTLAIGLLNLYEDGITDLSVWMDSYQNIYQGVETGSRRLYTLLYTGAKQENLTSMDERIFGGGFGFRFYPSFFDIDLVLGAKYEYETHRIWTPEAKASVGINLGSISLFGGVNGDFNIEGYNDDAIFFNENHSYELTKNVNLYYSWFAGVKLHM